MTAHEYMTVQDAADLAHVNHRTIRRWFRENRLGRYHIGPRRVLVKRSEIEAMIQLAAPPIHRDVPVVSSDRAEGV